MNCWKNFSMEIEAEVREVKRPKDRADSGVVDTLPAIEPLTGP